MKPLGEIVIILKGGKAPEVFNEPRPGAYPYLQIEDLRPDATPKYAIDKDGTLATKADVLIAWDGANAGTVGFDLEGYIGSTIAILRPTYNDIHAPYLGYFLRSKFNEIQDNTTGATIPHINRDHLENLRLPLPPLPEQRRIADLLSRADRLRRLRRVGDSLSASLLQSVFLEMFGDPTKNLKGWKKQKLESCCIQTVDCLHSTPNWTSSGVLCIRTSNLTVGGWNWSDTRYVSEQEYKERTVRSELYVGDIVLSREGTVGVAAIVYKGLKLCLGQRLVQVTPNQDIVRNEFLLHLFLYELAPERIKKVMAGSTSQHLNLQELRRMKIIVPPLPEQEQFAAVVRRVESLRARAGESARQGEGLFQSLLHEAFNA